MWACKACVMCAACVPYTHTVSMQGASACCTGTRSGGEGEGSADAPFPGWVLTDSSGAPWVPSQVSTS
jgi:hypothetical protein